MEKLLEYSQHNPGAMSFMVVLLQPENLVKSVSIMKKLEEAKSIRGTNLYVLWSDLCGREIEKVEILCKNCPTDILEDACSREDWSGVKLVSEYFS